MVSFGKLREGHAFGVKSTRRIDFVQGEQFDFQGNFIWHKPCDSKIRTTINPEEL